MLHITPTNYYLLAAKQKQYQKASLLMKHTEELSRKKKSQEWAGWQKKKK